MLASAALSMMLAYGHAGAQQWQCVLGATNRVEWSAEGTQPLMGGGYLVTGTTWTGWGDPYIARLNDDGTRAWAYRFDWGGDETAVCGRELKNGNGFLICGYADRNSDPALRSNAYLLRLDNLGRFVWMRSYGIAAFAEHAESFVEMPNGDYIVVGWTTSNAGDQGYAFRVNNLGGVIWGKVYTPPDSTQNVRFHSVDTCVIAPNTGRVIVGGYITRPDKNCLEVLLDAATGNIMAQTHFGLGNDDQVNAIRELRFPPNAGQFAATGSFTVNNQKIYCVKTSNNLAAILSEKIFFDNVNTSGSGWDLRGLRFTRPGNVVVAGDINNHDGLGINDMFVMELEPGTLTPAAGGLGFHVYGGVGGDGGITLNEVEGVLGRTAGVVASGNTVSPELMVPGDPQQIYVVKTNIRGLSGCNEDRVCIGVTSPKSLQFNPGLKEVIRDSARSVACTTRVTVPGHVRLCYPQPVPGPGLKLDWVADTTYNPVIDSLKCDTIPQDTIKHDTIPNPKDTFKFGNVRLKSGAGALPGVAAITGPNISPEAARPARRHNPLPEPASSLPQSRAPVNTNRGTNLKPDSH